jgi:8-oxo-dGTP diphosphatase
MAGDLQRVAIAVVEHAGHYLVGSRKPGQALAGLAEFPGGKCLAGEDAAACAIRECREETGVDVVAIRLLNSCRHEYPNGTLDLEFWLCHPAAREVGNQMAPPRGSFEWLPAQTLKSLHFPAANQPVIDLLTAGTEIVG